MFTLLLCDRGNAPEFIHLPTRDVACDTAKRLRNLGLTATILEDYTPPSEKK